MNRILRWILALPRAAASQQAAHVESPSGGTTVTLEQQLETLAQRGVRLNPGITVDDLLYSCERKEYETHPFDTILLVLGSEVERIPWGRHFSDQAWNFDVECIDDTGSYVTIVQNFCRVAGMPGLITEIEDFVDIENETAWLKYTIEGQPRHFTVAVDNDWADPETVSAVMEDIERDGRRFYGRDNGQASVWFYLDKKTAEELNALTGNALKLNR
jgi:hypothetical protein